VLKGKILPVGSLSAPQTKTMFHLMRGYYDNITEDNFHSDLMKKADVVLLCDENDVICGFTTLAVFHRGEGTQLLFSGDTIVDKKYWGNHDLTHVWVNNAMSRAETFKGKTYWLLLTKGYKTYKFLHTFFNTFYPRVDTEPPVKFRKLSTGSPLNNTGMRTKTG
jgi:hypothetical protein